jgi:hypothetical protein
MAFCIGTARYNGLFAQHGVPGRFGSCRFCIFISRRIAPSGVLPMNPVAQAAKFSWQDFSFFFSLPSSSSSL